MGLVTEIKASRELLLNLTKREVKGKYKRSIIGQGWSLLNPIAQLAIFSVVFGLVLKAGPDRGDPSDLNVFALWLGAGLLPWAFFAGSVTSGMSSIVANAGLITKVYFPRWVLVVSAVMANLVNFSIELAVLTVAIILFGGGPLIFVPLVAVTAIVLALFALGVAMLFAVANVYFRDTEHLIGILMQVWFYATPIVYPIHLVVDQMGKGSVGEFIYRLNPMERFVEVFRNLLYDNRLPEIGDVVACLVSTAIALTLGIWLFSRKQDLFAEEL
ncbi:ABC transporter permease [Nakamurella silvestris]|nr:ABC transporter permease [Nakamurella silvestris]